MSCEFLRLAAPGIQLLQAYQPGKPIEELKRDYGIQDVIKLASNENPLGPSSEVIAKIHENLIEVSRYPDANGYHLKQAIADKFRLTRDMLTLGNGSNDLLELIARTFVTASNSVIYSEHAFPIYSILVQAIGAEHICTPAKADYGHDLAAMQAAVKENTRLIFIANPNNPTGTWNTQTELKTLLDNLPAEVIVVVDQAYFEYVEEPEYPNAIQWLANYPNLIVTRTFSKAYGLAALRVGYAASQPEIADLLNLTRQPFNVNSVGMVAAQGALSDDVHLVDVIELNQTGMDFLTESFTQMGLSYIPSVANFVTVDVGHPSQLVYEGLLRAGIIVRPIASCGLPTHLRISIGLEDENEIFIEKLTEVLETLA